jgi:hypothetical protein
VTNSPSRCDRFVLSRSASPEQGLILSNAMIPWKCNTKTQHVNSSRYNSKQCLVTSPCEETCRITTDKYNRCAIHNRPEDSLETIIMKLLNSLVAVLRGSWSNVGQTAEPRPNFVFIMADDLGWADVAFHDGRAPTPNLDRLQASSLEITRHYVAPLCSPTRTGFLTGRYWSRFGITAPTNQRALPWDTITLPRALQSVGYVTCLTGKWHLVMKPAGRRSAKRTMATRPILDSPRPN